MIWPFNKWWGKKNKMPPINEDWRVGDLAACIDGSWLQRPGPSPGAIHKVTVVIAGRFRGSNEPAWGLGLIGWTGHWDATAFRKVQPDAEACEDEFKTLIKRITRRRQSAEARQ